MNMKEQYLLLNHKIAESAKGQSPQGHSPLNVRIKCSKAFPPNEVAVVTDVIQKVQKIRNESQNKFTSKTKFIEGLTKIEQ